MNRIWTGRLFTGYAFLISRSTLHLRSSLFLPIWILQMQSSSLGNNIKDRPLLWPWHGAQLLQHAQSVCHSPVLDNLAAFKVADVNHKRQDNTREKL